MKLYRRIVLLAIVALFLNLVSCSDDDDTEPKYNNPIKIGVLLPISAVRASAESKKLALLMAEDEINSAGGIMDRDIQFIFRDDEGLADAGVEQTKEFLNDSIKVILGAQWSSVTLAVAREVAIPNDMLLISSSSTNAEITNLDDKGLVWRTAPSDAIQGKVGADYVYNTLRKKTVGIIFINNAFGSGLAEIFKQEFEAFGGEALSFVGYPELPQEEAGLYDYADYLDTLFKDKPEAIYLIGYELDCAKISNDIIHEHHILPDYKPLFFSNDGPKGKNFLLNAHPDIIEGMMGTQPATRADDPNNMEFTQNFMDRFTFEPYTYNQNIYDCAYLVAYAMLKSGKTTPYGIAAELRNVSGGNPDEQGELINANEFAKAKEIIEGGGTINYNGASGKIDFDENGDPGSGTFVIWEIKHGDYINISTIDFP